MINLPTKINNRDDLDCRLGIKSSLSDIASVVALSYALYCANNKSSEIIYAEEIESNDKTKLILKEEYMRYIIDNYNVDEDTINKNPLLTSQLEALQVGLGLIFHLAKLSYVDYPTTDTKERTGGERYRKIMKFALNMKYLDLYLTAWSPELLRDELKHWLQNTPTSTSLSNGIKEILTCFSEATQFKIRNQGQEIIFQQYGIYDSFSTGNVVAKDDQEDVGPFRIFKSFVREDLHPFIALNGNEFINKDSANLPNYKKMVDTTLNLYPKKTVLYIEVPTNSTKNVIEKTSRQIIYYGAPGTGKSHKIKKILGEYDGCPEDKKVPKENIFRTTFHPDSDYSTFVGAYKPKTEKQKNKIYTKGELISKLTEMKDGGITYSPQKFGAKYWCSLKQLSLADKKDILQACGMSDNYTVEFDKGTAVGEEYLAGSDESRIIYSFIPQAFLNAYIRAYQTDENVYLIIEEINRGNCAQIFGDLFQLLDRDQNGKSEYTIKADADLKAFLEEKLGEDNPGIKDGELCLPSNLYIYATMNTSDQSLFPIDSAFKRRWDWEYEPIKYSNTKWEIDIQDRRYSWVSFQKIVNDKIFDATHSEDKMLGDFFVNPGNQIISEKMLVDKILFYLWNDVCKDGEGDIFKVNDSEDISFSQLYGEDGSIKLIDMMAYLKVAPFVADAGIGLEDSIIDDNEILDQSIKDWYKGIWDDVIDNIRDKVTGTLPSSAPRQNYQLSVGITGISAIAKISKQKNNCFIGYYIEKQQSSTLYPKLLAVKGLLEDKLGKLEWQYNEGHYGVAKISKSFSDLSDSEERDKLIEMISETLPEFYNAIIPLIEKLR